jgi:hypothetical protein
METKENSRYPYTYACDYIRMIPEKEMVESLGVAIGVKLSRSEASQIRSKIADVIGMDDRELAEKLADAYLKEYPA